MFDKAMFIRRMYDLRIGALESPYYKVQCAEEVKPLVNAFFENAENEIQKWDGDVFVPHRIEQISECVKNLARNTRKFEELSQSDMMAINSMFEEMNILLQEALQIQQEKRENLRDKISCINAIFEKNQCCAEENECPNWRGGLLLNYEELYKVIHQVNTEWEDLKRRGFSQRRFYEYALSVYNARYNEKVMRELLSSVEVA